METSSYLPLPSRTAYDHGETIHCLPLTRLQSTERTRTQAMERTRTRATERDGEGGEKEAERMMEGEFRLYRG